MRTVRDGTQYHAACSKCDWVGPTAYDTPQSAMRGAKMHYQAKHPQDWQDEHLPGLADYGYTPKSFVGEPVQTTIC